MAWRRAATGPAAEAAVELEDLASEYASAARGGDRWAADHLTSVLSWIDAVRSSGGDPVIVDLFAEFARVDRALWLEVRGGVA